MTITNTRRFYRGEIWTTIAYAFPHERDEYVTPRERPVLIVQNDEDNAASGYPIVLIAPITTRKLDRIYEQDVFLPADQTGLLYDSKVLLGLTTTLLKTDLEHCIGQVSGLLMEEVDAKLLRLFGLL